MRHEYKRNRKMFYIAALAAALAFAGYTFHKPRYVRMITASELNQVMQNEDIFLVDVHIPEQRHIKGTDLFIPYNAIEQHQAKLPKDQNAAIYVYCEGGPMGNAAAKALHALGYRNLINLEGGANAWRKQGFAVE